MGKNDIYPLTIIRDRYGGIYSGGEYTAWNEDFYSLPEEIDGDDVTAARFFYKCDSYCYGTGKTPDEALEDLIRKIEGSKGAYI